MVCAGPTEWAEVSIFETKLAEFRYCSNDSCGEIYETIWVPTTENPDIQVVDEREVRPTEEPYVIERINRRLR